MRGLTVIAKIGGADECRRRVCKRSCLCVFPAPWYVIVCSEGGGGGVIAGFRSRGLRHCKRDELALCRDATVGMWGGGVIWAGDRTV